MDCEGCEWAVVERLAADHPRLLARIDQIAIELHAYRAPTAPSEWQRATAAASSASTAAAPSASTASRPGAPPPDTTTATPSPPRWADFTLARLRTFCRHVLREHGFVVAHRHLNLHSLLKDHRFDRLLPASGRPAAPPRPRLWSYWELLLVRPGGESR